MKARALILAAGQGTRLRPLTKNKPKCLVKLCGHTLLEIQVKALNNNNITKIHIATGFCSEQIKKLGFKISFNAKFAETNMVETLFSARDFINEDGELIIAYGDIVYESKNLEALLKCNDEIALMIDSKWKKLWSLRIQNPLEDAETLVMDNNNYVLELGKKPNNYNKIQGQYTGLIKVRADKVQELVNFYDNLDRKKLYDGKKFQNMYMTSFIQELINSNWKVKAVLVNNGWLEIDTVKDLNNYEQMSKDGRLDEFYKIFEK